MSTASSGIRGPVRPSERAPAPDLARGVMLLLICIANTPWFLLGRDYTDYTIHPPDASVLDRAAQFVIITGIDARIYPMFAFLFGYGMVQLLRRQRAAGAPEPAALALLQRRNLWLLAFGAVHALLLYVGDVLGAYGLAGMLLVWLFLRRSDSTLLLWAGILTGVLTLATVADAVGSSLAGGGVTDTMSVNNFVLGTEGMRESDPLIAGVGRVGPWVFISLFQGVFGLVTPVAILLGFWAARHSVLEEPERHLPLLRRTAAVGIAVGWLGALPLAAYHVGLVAMPEGAGAAMSSLTSVTGLAGGVGYAAVFGLLGHRMRSRGHTPGILGAAVTAVGKRSLSCYLAQSVLCAPILSAWGLGLGAALGSASMLVFAVAVWLVIAVAAYALERAGRRGPAEVLLRRLTYRQSTATGGG